MTSKKKKMRKEKPQAEEAKQDSSKKKFAELKKIYWTGSLEKKFVTVSAAIGLIYSLVTVIVYAIIPDSIIIFISVTLAVFLLSLICTVLLKISEIETNRDTSFERHITDLVKSMGAVEINEFPSDLKDDQLMEYVDEYIASRISIARHSVRDLVWQSKKNIGNRFSLNELTDSEKQIDDAIKVFCRDKKNQGKYQELVVLSTASRFYKIQRHCRTANNKYECRHIPYRAKGNSRDNIIEETFPKIQFVLIDEEEIIFASSAYGRNICAIKSAKLGSILAEYFDNAWDSAETIHGRNPITNISGFAEKTLNKALFCMFMQEKAALSNVTEILKKLFKPTAEKMAMNDRAYIEAMLTDLGVDEYMCADDGIVAVKEG